MTMKVDAHVNGARADILSTIDDWLALDDRPIVEEPVPEFGMFNDKPRVVLLRAMDALARDEWDLRWISNEPYESDPVKAQAIDRKATYHDRLAGVKPALLARCIVNEAGQPIFTVKDVSILESRNAAVIHRLYVRAHTLCGMDPPALAKIEEQIKNSDARPADEQPSV